MIVGGEKTALIDTVDTRFSKQLLGNVAEPLRRKGINRPSTRTRHSNKVQVKNEELLIKLRVIGKEVNEFSELLEVVQC